MEEYNILWIDDDINGPELLSERDALEEKGCNITPITHPDELQINVIPSFNCIIMDLFMPVGKKLSLQETKGGSRTGFVLLKKITEKFPNSLIVIYTVFDIPEVKNYCNNKQHICYLSKSSFSAEEFADKIVELINNNV